MRLASTAAVLGIALAGSPTTVPNGTDEPVDECLGRLLAVASVHTDSFARLTLFPDAVIATERAGDDGVSGDVRCSGDAGAADIAYFVTEGEATVDDEFAEDAAIGDDLAVVEPGGDAQARLDDPGETWGDVAGVADLVAQLSGDQPQSIELALPDPDHSPVHLIAASVGHPDDASGTGRVARLVWLFAHDDAEQYVEAIESLLSDAADDPGAAEVEVVRADEVHATLEQSAEAMGRRPYPPMLDLALLDAVPVASADTPSTVESSVANTDETSVDQEYPDIDDVTLECRDGRYDFAVTVRSPYDTPERYADGWRIVGEDGTVYGTHELAHDHASEQPFTRTQSGVEIPVGVDEVVVEGHDLVNGYGGTPFPVTLPDCPAS